MAKSVALFPGRYLFNTIFCCLSKAPYFGFINLWKLLSIDANVIPNTLKGYLNHLCVQNSKGSGSFILENRSNIFPIFYCFQTSSQAKLRRKNVRQANGEEYGHSCLFSTSENKVRIHSRWDNSKRVFIVLDGFLRFTVPGNRSLGSRCVTLYGYSRLCLEANNDLKLQDIDSQSITIKASTYDYSHQHQKKVG